MTGFSKDEMKEVTKEALKEWLDEKFTTFGRWTFRALASVAFVGLIYFVLKSNGWVKN